MADAASTIVDYFKGKGKIAYINVLVNISRVCDCGGKRAPPPNISDIGILASLDPVAIDQACYDLIYNEHTAGSEQLINQSTRLLGLNTLKVAEELGIGSRDYNLIDVDKEEKNYTWYIVIGVIGFVVVVAIIGVIIYYFKIKKSPEKEGKLVCENDLEDGGFGDGVI